MPQCYPSPMKIEFGHGEEKYLQVKASGKWKWTFGQIQKHWIIWIAYKFVCHGEEKYLQVNASGKWKWNLAKWNLAKYKVLNHYSLFLKRKVLTRS